MDKLQKICLNIIAGIGTIIFAVLSYYSLRYTVTRYYSGHLIDGKDNIISGLIWFILTVILAVLVKKTVCTSKKSKLVVHIAAVICSAGAVLLCFKLMKSADFQPITDALQIVYNAVYIAKGDYEAVYDMGYGYFRLYPYQLGLVELYTFLFKLTGKSSYDIILTVQSVLTGVAVYAGFRTVRELFDDIRSEIIYLLLILSFLPIYFYAMFYYGETWGICFAMLGIWMFTASISIKNQGKKRVAAYFIAATLFMCVACVARGALIIVWIAMLCIQFIVLLKRKKILPFAAMFIMLAAILTAEHGMTALAERQTGLDFGDGCPKLMWIAMGLDENEGSIFGPGSYNGFNADNFIASGYDTEVCTEMAKEHIAENIQTFIQNPRRMISFFKTKTMNQWNEPTYGAFYHTYYIQNQQEWVDRVYFDDTVHGNVMNYMNRYQFILYFSILGYFISLFRSKSGNKYAVEKYLPGLIIIGEFMLSLLWECRSRYVYPYIVLAVPCAVAGLMMYADILMSSVHNVKKHFHNK